MITISIIFVCIGILVGVVGLFVGMVGLKCLNKAKNDNSVSSCTSSNIQQAQIINNGLDSYAVIKITRETTQEELQKLVQNLDLMGASQINLLLEQNRKETNFKIKSIE